MEGIKMVKMIQITLGIKQRIEMKMMMIL